MQDSLFIIVNFCKLKRQKEQKSSTSCHLEGTKTLTKIPSLCKIHAPFYQFQRKNYAIFSLIPSKPQDIH